MIGETCLLGERAQAGRFREIRAADGDAGDDAFHIQSGQDLDRAAEAGDRRLPHIANGIAVCIQTGISIVHVEATLLQFERIKMVCRIEHAGTRSFF